MSARPAAVQVSSTAAIPVSGQPPSSTRMQRAGSAVEASYSSTRCDGRRSRARDRNFIGGTAASDHEPRTRRSRRTTDAPAVGVRPKSSATTTKSSATRGSERTACDPLMARERRLATSGATLSRSAGRVPSHCSALTALTLCGRSSRHSLPRMPARLVSRITIRTRSTCSSAPIRPSRPGARSLLRCEHRPHQPSRLLAVSSCRRESLSSSMLYRKQGGTASVRATDSVLS